MAKHQWERRLGRCRGWKFDGQVGELTPHLENGQSELSFTHRLKLPDGTTHGLKDLQFFSGRPALVLVGHRFYLLRNAPPDGCCSIGSISQPSQCES
jgi:hypothetical protein